MEQNFTKYEIARIIGARALQIAMDAPLLLKISSEEMEGMNYDALKIAEFEFGAGVLPIAISRPTPKKKNERLGAVREDKSSDEELLAKEQELEKEFTEEAKQLGLLNEGEEEEAVEDAPDGMKEE